VAGKVIVPKIPGEKRCTRCNEVKTASEFYLHNYTTKGRNTSKKLSRFCNPCRSEHGKEEYRKSRVGVAPKPLGRPRSPGGRILAPRTPDEKRCPQCGEIKLAAQFGISSFTTPAGDTGTKLRSWCKPCSSAYVSARRIRRPFIPHDITQPKQCNMCKTVKPADEFPFITRNGRKALGSYCNQCESDRRKTEEYKIFRRAYEKQLRTEGRLWINKAEGKNYAAEYYQQNKEQIRQRNKAFRDANPEIMRKRYIAAIYKKLAAGCDKRLKHIKLAITEALDSYRIDNMYWDVYSSELIEVPTIDHIVPLSAGGVNTADNFCVTSRLNNSSKNNLPLLVWLAKRLSAQPAPGRPLGRKLKTTADRP
jgi:hypothetical protein